MTDQWYRGVGAKTGAWEEGRCHYQKAARGIFVVTELFFILAVMDPGTYTCDKVT